MQLSRFSTKLSQQLPNTIRKLHNGFVTWASESSTATGMCILDMGHDMFVRPRRVRACCIT